MTHKWIVKKVEQVPFSPFTELLTEGFDNDQIWEEIASQNEPFLDYAKTTLKTLSHKHSAQQQKTVTFDEEEEDDQSVSSGQLMDLDEDHEMQELSQENDDETEDDDDMEEDQEDEEEEELEEEDDEGVEPEVIELKNT